MELSYLVICVEKQADGAVRGLQAHELVVFPLRLGVVGSTLPQLGQGLGPLLHLLWFILHIHIQLIYKIEVGESNGGG